MCVSLPPSLSLLLYFSLVCLFFLPLLRVRRACRAATFVLASDALRLLGFGKLALGEPGLHSGAEVTRAHDAEQRACRWCLPMLEDSRATPTTTAVAAAHAPPHLPAQAPPAAVLARDGHQHRRSKVKLHHLRPEGCRVLMVWG